MDGKVVRIGAGSGGLIDSPIGIIQHLQSETAPDYVVFDHLAEGVMALFAMQLRTAPETGFSPTFIANHIGPFLPGIMERGVKIVSNAGGLNPHGLAKAIQEHAATLGLSPVIGVVTGDDLQPRLSELAGEGHRDMFSGAPWPDRIIAANAYMGAFPIAEALRRGADIVITGRVVDSALALGPLIHEFGWGREDYDRLSAGTLVGHLLECGAQSTGGTFTDWFDIADKTNMGFPVAECRADGSFVLTKPEGTGGLVSFGTVAEQILYEVSDPAAYLMPDVSCDFTALRLEEVGPDRVEVTGAIGRAPTGAYKACVVSEDGYKAVGLMPVFGHNAAHKARAVAESVIGRARLINDAAGLPPPRFTHYELVGAGELVANAPVGNAQPSEVFARVVCHADDARSAQIFAFECNTPCLNGSPGSLPFSAGGSVAPVTPLFCFTIARDRFVAEVTVDGETVALEPETARPAAGPHRPAMSVSDEAAGRCDAAVPLIALAYGRSGDKGNLFNIGVIARRPEFLPYIRASLTAEAVGGWMRHTFDDADARRVTRFEVPGFDAVNFVLHDTLQGGVGTSIRFDTNAKSMGQQLLQMPVAVPGELARKWETGGRV